MDGGRVAEGVNLTGELARSVGFSQRALLKLNLESTEVDTTGTMAIQRLVQTLVWIC